MQDSSTLVIVIPFRSKEDRDKGLDGIVWEPKDTPVALYAEVIKPNPETRNAYYLSELFEGQYLLILILNGCWIEILEFILHMKVHPHIIPNLLKSLILIHTKDSIFIEAEEPHSGPFIYEPAPTSSDLQLLFVFPASIKNGTQNTCCMF